MNTYEDSRFVKTRKKIISSLLDLLKEMPFEDITISKLCKEAKISRTTFYSHFENIADIFNTFQYQLVQEIFAELPKDKRDILEALKSVVRVWDRHYWPLKILLSPEYGLNVDSQALNKMEQNIKRSFLPLLPVHLIPAEDQDYYASFYAGGIYALLKKWLTDQHRLSSEALLEKMLLFIPQMKDKDKLSIPTRK